MFPLVSQTIAATPPLLSVLKMAYRNPKTDLTKGVLQKKLASEAYRAIGASHEIVSPIALYWDTKSLLSPEENGKTAEIAKEFSGRSLVREDQGRGNPNHQGMEEHGVVQEPKLEQELCLSLGGTS